LAQARAVQGIHPLNLDVASPPLVARWRPLVNWILVIPPSIWLLILSFGAVAVAVAGWFSALLTGRIPERWGDYQMAVLRYQWRTNAFLYAWTDSYPGFATPAGYVDPGDFPAVLYCARPQRRNRVTVALRLLLIIPHYVVLYFVSIAAGAVLLAAWFVVLVTARWPAGMRRFVIGYLRWSSRVAGYGMLATDEYPPFGFAA
jgi:hypothetical protein